MLSWLCRCCDQHAEWCGEPAVTQPALSLLEVARFRKLGGGNKMAAHLRELQSFQPGAFCSGHTYRQRCSLPAGSEACRRPRRQQRASKAVQGQTTELGLFRKAPADGHATAEEVPDPEQPAHAAQDSHRQEAVEAAGLPEAQGPGFSQSLRSGGVGQARWCCCHPPHLHCAAAEYGRSRCFTVRTSWL